MLVYRVENSDGVGMYNTFPGFTGDEGGWHPTPEQDPKLMKALDGREIRGLHFAFTSLYQLKAWVVGDAVRRSLHKEGHRIHVYSCDEVYGGEAQAVFRKETARIISVMSLLAI